MAVVLLEVIAHFAYTIRYDIEMTDYTDYSILLLPQIRIHKTAKISVKNLMIKLKHLI